MDPLPFFLGMELSWPYVQHDDYYISVLPNDFGLLSRSKYQFPTEIPVVQHFSSDSADANRRACPLTWLYSSKDCALTSVNPDYGHVDRLTVQVLCVNA